MTPRYDDPYGFGSIGASNDQSVEEPEEATRKSLSVSDAMALAKGALESVTVTLIGEVSEFSNKAGYKAVYFTVKDDRSALPCMMWMNRFNALGIDVQVGDLVELTGRFTLYAAKGRMNFDVFSLSLAGEGVLRLKVAQLANKLQSEGLMDPSRKLPIPSMPQRIGVVTSPRGAAVHDVLRTLRRRFPLAEICFAGVPVEGPSAPEYIIEGLRCVYRAHPDVILLVRGGGSFEDLMPFNDETLARAIAACPIPVVTGIGHEPDTSIADMVADLRASTPTAAAESVSPSMSELVASLDAMASRAHRAISYRLDFESNRVDKLSSRPVFKDPRGILAPAALGLDYACDRLSRIGETLVAAYADKLASTSLRLHDLSPLLVLGRGYSIAKREGRVVRSVHDVSLKSPLELIVSDGTISCEVTGFEGDEAL